MSDEIECRECGGQGQIDLVKGTGGPSTWPDCRACKGTGWRAHTQDEADELAEAAYDRSLEGEPPMSMQERYERDWKQKQEFRR